MGALESNKPERIAEAIISSVYTEPYEWILDQCVRFATYEHKTVRHSIALALGTIAIKGRDRLDLGLCLTLAGKLERDQDEAVRVAADDARGEILHAKKLQASHES
jgi:hypothetical protein